MRRSDAEARILCEKIVVYINVHTFEEFITALHTAKS